MLAGESFTLFQNTFLFSMLAMALGNCNQTQCELCVLEFPDGMSVSCIYKHLTTLPYLPLNVFKLRLSYNDISTLATGMFNIPELTARLKLLFLDNNGIIAIQSDAFVGITKLEHLDLSHNTDLKTLENITFSSLSNLQYLNLQNSGLISLAQDVFLPTPLLQNLQLSSNNLSFIPPKTFEAAKELRTLDLSRNNIEKLGKDIFYGPLNLSNLNLSHNLITIIEGLAFQQLVNLKTLELAYNYLTAIDINLLQPLIQLQLLKLEGNPWDCTCSASDLHDWIRQFRGNVTGPFCSIPHFLAGKGELGHLPPECYIHCPKHEPKENCVFPPATQPPINLQEVIPRLTNLVYMCVAISVISVAFALAASVGTWIVRRQHHSQTILYSEDDYN